MGGMYFDGAAWRPASGLSRRAFLERAGLVGLGAVVAQLPGFLAGKGWLEDAMAQSPEIVRDTYNGLVAFVVPGPDAYSVAQGERSTRPGGIAAGATDQTIELLDGFLTGPVGDVPTSVAVAQLLNGKALEVDPTTAVGQFLTPYSRLSFAEKIEVYRRLEQETEGTGFRFLFGTLLLVVAYFSYGEGAVFDRSTRRLTGTPVGYTLSSYDGVSDGWPELKGYYQGRREVFTSPVYGGPA